jgi:hypothetical protein
MNRPTRLLVVSDAHYAGEGERARRGWEGRAIRQPALRSLAGMYRRFLWLADPTAHNHQLDAFIAAAGSPDWVVANGDYSCDSAFVGVADDAARESAAECLGKLRGAFGERVRCVLGDHELGKMSLFGGVGGPRIRSLERAVMDLRVAPFWEERVDSGWALMGVASSLLALPLFEPELLREEVPRWREAREAHLEAVRNAFATAPDHARLVLFCHDPSALPFLAQLPEVERRLGQVAATVIGHLHSPFVWRASRWLSGIPEISFAGVTARRISAALRKARGWAPFRVILCPSLAGIELLKDGGYLELTLGEGGLEARRHRLPWRT